MIAFEPRSAAFRANPYPVYQQLREQDPVFFRETYKDWLISRYDDINRLLKDRRIGYIDDDDLPIDPAQWQDLPPHLNYLAQLQAESKRLNRLWVINKNPPTHTRLHKLFHHGLTLEQKKLASRTHSLANQLLDRVQHLGKLDILGDYAVPLTMTIICEILGIPESDRGTPLSHWAHTLAMTIDLDLEPAVRRRRPLVLIGLTQYFRKLIANKQSDVQVQGVFVKLMVQAWLDGKLSEDELLANYSLLLIAGYSTTAHAIGNGMLALLNHPAQLQRLQVQPALIKKAVNECLRYDATAQFVSRTVLEDVECGGKLLRAGQQVQLLIGSGNRDPEQFPEPDKFDISRTPNRYLSFGLGMHHCIGARLALLITRIGIGTLVRRLPHIALSDAALEWEESYLIHGLKALPVVF